MSSSHVLILLSNHILNPNAHEFVPSGIITGASVERPSVVNVEVTPVDQGVDSLNAVRSVEQVTASVTAGAECDSMAKLDLNPFTMDMSIDKFLAREFILDRFDWLQSEPVGTCLKTYCLPYELLVMKTLLCKIERYQFLRCDFEVTIKVVGSQFHYGRLLMAFNPAPFDEGWLIPTENLTLSYAASSHHVQISPNGISNMTLQVPFSLTKPFYDLAEIEVPEGIRRNTSGIVNIWVLNNLRSSGEGSLPVTVSAKMVNISLSGPTCATHAVATPIYPAYPIVHEYDTLLAADYIYTQGLDQEQLAKSKEGLISGVAEKVASFAAPFSVLPVVGEVASAVAAGALSLGGIAKSLGYSKPNDMRAAMPVFGEHGIYPHCTGLEGARIVAYNPACKTSPANETISGHPDDMQLSRVCSTPGLVKTFDILPAWTANTQCCAMWVTPLSVQCTRSGSIGPPDERVITIAHTPLSYCSVAFNKWRGAIRYLIQIVASSMHTGSIRITWIPNIDGTDDSWPVSNEAFDNCISKVVEIKGTTEVSFTVPYQKSQHWSMIGYCKGGETAGDRIPPYASNFNGRIFVHVVDPIKHPIVPVQPISCNVWHSAGSTYQLTAPCSLRMKVATIQAGKKELKKDDLMHGGYSLDAMRTMEYPPLVPFKGYVDNNCCDADTVTCLKKLLSVPQWVGRYSLLPNVPLVINPFSLMHPLSTPDVFYGFYDWFLRLYRWARGGFTLRIVPDFSSSGMRCVFYRINSLKSPKRRYTVLSAYSLDHAINRSSPQMELVGNALYNPWRATFPYSSTTPGVRLGGHRPNTAGGVGDGETTELCVIQTFGARLESQEFHLYENVADDFELGQRVGIQHVNHYMHSFLTPASAITWPAA